MKYTVYGLEQVYDTFDDSEHYNELAPVVVEASSVENAKLAGRALFRRIIRASRKGFATSGEFIPLVTRICDASGDVVRDDQKSLRRC